jgi:RNA polymerase sigma-70 factor (ECF subfamily)
VVNTRDVWRLQVCGRQIPAHPDQPSAAARRIPRMQRGRRVKTDVVNGRPVRRLRPRVESRDQVRSDPELLSAVGDRDRGALRELYERHAPWLRARLARRCGDDGLVEEVVQDTFLALWRKPGAYRGSGDVAAWIWGIGIRRLLSALRPRRAVPWPVIGLISDATTPSAEDEVLLRVEHGDLACAVDGLSPELRAVVQAVVLDGLTSREAARLLGLPAGTIRTRLMRARTQLREALL